MSTAAVLLTFGAAIVVSVVACIVVEVAMRRWERNNPDNPWG